MKLYTFYASTDTNTYLLATDAGKALVIDPAEPASVLLGFLEEHKLTLTKILLTHGHYDHISGVSELQKATGAQLLVHEDDAAMIADGELCLATLFHVEDYEPLIADTLLQDGDTITQDEITLTVLHTPGHTEGSICFLTGDMMFAGDTLFAGSVGRTDLAGGSPEAQRESLLRLKKIERDYRVYPGHGGVSTLAHERAANPYLRYVGNEFDF